MKFVSIFLFLCILVLSCIATPASANSIPIQNASFSVTNPLTISCGTGCAYNNGPIPGWTLTGGSTAGSWQPSSAYFSSVPGSGIVAFSNGPSISQTLSASLAANTTYTLSVDVGNRLDAITNNLATTFIIQLFAGNTLLNSITGSNTAIPLGTFLTQSFSYMSGATVPSGNLAIVLSTAGPQSDFANVQLTAVTPEPASLTLLAAAFGFALILFRRR